MGQGRNEELASNVGTLHQCQHWAKDERGCGNVSRGSDGLSGRTHQREPYEVPVRLTPSRDAPAAFWLVTGAHVGQGHREGNLAKAQMQ